MIKTVLTINSTKEIGTIAPEIYGQFSEHLGRCVYEGIFVGRDSDIPNTDGIRNDVVEALKAIRVPVLRWPGGCFADEYHWRDGIGPLEKRRRMVNTNWGGAVEDNSFGTHEFLNLCERIGCEPYIAVNVGSGTVREAAEWIEYMTASGGSTLAKLRESNGRREPWRVKYIGIGNESWGCGGSMEPAYYASEYKKFQQFCKDYDGNRLYKIACGPNGDDYNWTRELLSRINKWHTKAISLHYYTVPNDWEHKGSATDFDEREYYVTLQKTRLIEEIIDRHLAIMDELDKEREISLIVDEWGTWYDVEPGTNPGFLYQQNTMRDALAASINLNIFNSRCTRISMANIAQAVNVLQAMLLTEGAKLVKTPTYEVFDMYKEHQGSRLVESGIFNTETGTGDVKIPALSQSVSIKEQEGAKYLTITVSNASLDEDAELEVTLADGAVFDREAKISVLTGDMRDCNTFEEPDRVRQERRTEIWNGGVRRLTVPACGVASVSCALK
ncbi:MAG: alpha-N-arabinofuranosidase [Butyrivibrio sp.]|nr:alpha-N-arabinofuranosidase [Butyrivibrio sp.]